MTLLTGDDRRMLRSAGDKIRQHLTEGRHRQAVAHDLADRLTRNPGPLSEPGRCQWCGALTGLINDGLPDAPPELACRDEAACQARGAAQRPALPGPGFIQSIRDGGARRVAAVRSRRDWPFLIDLANQVASLIRCGQDCPFSVKVSDPEQCPSLPCSRSQIPNFVNPHTTAKTRSAAVTPFSAPTGQPPWEG